jgi:hypothetical protein
MTNKILKNLSPKQCEELYTVLKTRFEKNKGRHKGLVRTTMHAKLETNTEKLWSLSEMERTGGEPDVVSYDETLKEYIFYDCSPESPAGRRTLCSCFFQIKMIQLPIHSLKPLAGFRHTITAAHDPKEHRHQMIPTLKSLIKPVTV